MAEVKDFTKYIKNLQKKNAKNKDEDENPFAALNGHNSALKETEQANEGVSFDSINDI